MDLKDSLTPKNVEEVRPNFFIQKTNKGYRQVNPIVWKGEYRIKEQLKTILSLRTVFTIAIVLFIAWSYTHDVGAYQEFYLNVTENPDNFCRIVERSQRLPDGSIEFNISEIEVIFGEQKRE